MAKTKNNNANEPLMDSGPIVMHFGAIEILNEFYAENGWRADYRQVEAGIMTSQISGRVFGRINVFREKVSHKIECFACSPEHFFSIVISMTQDQLSINGHCVSKDILLLIPPKTDLEISAIGGSDAVTIQLSADTLSEYLRVVCRGHSLVEESGISAFRMEENSIGQLRRMLNKVTRQTLQINTYAATESELSTMLSSLLVGPASKKIADDPYGRLAKHRIMTRAKEFIAEHSNEQIKVTDLCKHCGVSLSTLERSFRRGMDISPKEYILAVRLHNARRMLLDPEYQDLSIADIAMHCGFMHMGRFPQHYRNYFGSLPSDNRHSSIN